jgi:hypothetical protein
MIEMIEMIRMIRMIKSMREAEDHATARIEAGPTDQHTLPRPNEHPQALALLGRTSDELTFRGLEAKELLGQLSDHNRLEGGGDVHGKVSAADAA